MTEETYQPCYLDSITEVSDRYYILNCFSRTLAKEDYYYEMHIESDHTLEIIKTYVDGYIYVELISASKLEIHTGEFYSESFSDGEMGYTRFFFTEVEKASRLEWKSKVMDLREKFDDLLKERVSDYEFARNKVVDKYQSIYDQHIQSGNTFGLTVSEISKTNLFNRLYTIFNGSVSTYYLDQLAGANGKTTLMKDWALEYLDWETRFNNVVKVNLKDDQLIKTHVVNIYTNTFEHMMSNLKYNYKNVDELKYTRLFNSVIQGLN
ncbi:hypothetical protein [Pedobacter sp. FW305-3-2-15-E-R2A2]|uniref:hypothetical protein n=1 Tax=Pedobacter sp. FW305-3-2-15-E-R2A2 TaxID=3140251 RepID=UPI00313FEF28